MREKILVGVLALVGACWALIEVDKNRQERGLLEAAQPDIARMMSFYPPGMNPPTATAATISKQYLVFGPAVGKVSVFFRSRDQHNTASYMVVDYYYALTGGQWILTERSGCAHDDVCVRASKAFEE
jgi:hypothetical protein